MATEEDPTLPAGPDYFDHDAAAKLTARLQRDAELAVATVAEDLVASGWPEAHGWINREGHALVHARWPALDLPAAWDALQRAGIEPDGYGLHGPRGMTMRYGVLVYVSTDIRPEGQEGPTAIR